MCYEKAKRMYGDPLPENGQGALGARIELNSSAHGYDVMYMIAQKLVREVAAGRLSGRLPWFGWFLAGCVYVGHHRGKFSRRRIICARNAITSNL